MFAVTYVLRYFFDWGACLWAANDAARRDFGYPVAHERLGLPTALVARLDAAIVAYQGSIDPNDPGGPSPWTPAECAAFSATTDILLADLRTELGAHFSIRDERASF